MHPDPSPPLAIQNDDFISPQQNVFPRFYNQLPVNSTIFDNKPHKINKWFIIHLNNNYKYSFD